MMTFTDAEAAQRLLDRHNRAIASKFDDMNLHSAEYLIKLSAQKFLEQVISTDAPKETD